MANGHIFILVVMYNRSVRSLAVKPPTNLIQFNLRGSVCTQWCTLKDEQSQGGYKEMSSILTNRALVYEPKCGGGGGCRVSANE